MTERKRRHRRLFDGIYKLAGRIRDYNITKNEWVLGGKTVYYASADTISDTLIYKIPVTRRCLKPGEDFSPDEFIGAVADELPDALEGLAER